MGRPNATLSTASTTQSALYGKTVLFVTVSLAYIVSYFHRAAMAVVAPELVDAQTVSMHDIGSIGAAYFWAYAAACLPAGLLTDKFGARVTMAAFCFVAGAGTFIFAQADSAYMLVVARCLIGFGLSAVYIAAMRLFSDWFARDELATCSGALLAVGNVGGLLSTLPLTMLMASAGLRHTFEGIGFYTVLVAIVAAGALRDAAPGQPAHAPAQTRLLPLLRSIFTSADFYLLSFALFVYYGTLMGVGSLWLGPYIQDVYATSKAATSAVLLFLPLGMTLGCSLSGYLSDKVLKSRKKTLLLGCAAHACCYLPLILCVDNMDMPWLRFQLFLFGVSGGFFVSCFACVKELFDERCAATSVGALNTIMAVGAACFQYALGRILPFIDAGNAVAVGGYSAHAYRVLFLASMGALLLGLVALTKIREG